MNLATFGICRKYGGCSHDGYYVAHLYPNSVCRCHVQLVIRSRWQRMWVGLAGVIVELFVAAVATVVWVNTARE